jgi:hypothetical protein
MKKTIGVLALVGLCFVLGYWGNSPKALSKKRPEAAPLELKKSLPTAPRGGSVSAATVSPASSERRVLPAPQIREVKYHPRAEGEWQGMPVDIAVTPYCEKTDDCQLARACSEQVCTVCLENRDCGAGEVCVLDHCLLEENASCTEAKDCPSNELCMLESTGSDALSDRRGNKFLLAECTTNGHGKNREQPKVEAVLPELAPDPPAGPGSVQTSGLKQLQSQFAQGTIHED